MLHWPARRWLVAAGAAVAAGLAAGIPTGIVRTSLYTRMTPVRWWDYPFWIVASALVGLTSATYVRTEESSRVSGQDRPGRSIGGSLLSVFAIGCPVCNKLVVAVLGFSGALTYFAPIQPLLGFASVALLAYGLRLRLRGGVQCAVVPSDALAPR